MPTPPETAAIERWLAALTPHDVLDDPVETFAYHLLWAACMRTMAEAQQALRQRPRDASHN